jgi:hypothetical protein
MNLVLTIGLAVVGTTAGWVYGDARARGIPGRKATTWALLQAVEWPLFLWLYRRARPAGVKPTPRRPVPEDSPA